MNRGSMSCVTDAAGHGALITPKIQPPFSGPSRKDQHFGLGDKSGPLDRSGRRFRMRQMDALGYNAETGDPLYKHVFS